MTIKEMKLLGKYWQFVFMAKMITQNSCEWEEDGEFYKGKMEQFNADLKKLMATTDEWVPPSKLKHNPTLMKAESFPGPENG